MISPEIEFREIFLPIQTRSDFFPRARDTSIYVLVTDSQSLMARNALFETFFLFLILFGGSDASLRSELRRLVGADLKVSKIVKLCKLNAR